MRRILVPALVAAAAFAAPAAPASAEVLCVSNGIETCFDGTELEEEWDLAIYLACRILSDGGGGC